MTTALDADQTETGYQRHRWTVAEYHRMGEVGLLNEDSRVELIDGEIVEMAPIGSEHGGKVNRFIYSFSRFFGDQTIIAAHNPVVLGGYGEPQPDIAILRWREDYYERAHPHAEDVLLLVEVSDSTHRYDRDVKVPLYASRGIPEIWLLDLQQPQLEIYREPVRGQYRQRDCRRTGIIAPFLCPEAGIDLAELFPNS